MTATVDLFWSFRSPYSYLATPGARQLAQDFDVVVRFRPVLPLAVRDPAFFSPDNLKRARYIGMDWVRRAQMLGMPHRWPSPDPVAQDLDTYRIAAEQPHIHRLTHLGVEAQRQSHGLDFAFEAELGGRHHGGHDRRRGAVLQPPVRAKGGQGKACHALGREVRRQGGAKLRQRRRIGKPLHDGRLLVVGLKFGGHVRSLSVVPCGGEGWSYSGRVSVDDGTHLLFVPSAATRYRLSLSMAVTFESNSCR